VRPRVRFDQQLALDPIGSDGHLERLSCGPGGVGPHGEESGQTRLCSPFRASERRGLSAARSAPGLGAGSGGRPVVVVLRWRPCASGDTANFAAATSGEGTSIAAWERRPTGLRTVAGETSALPEWDLCYRTV